MLQFLKISYVLIGILFLPLLVDCSDSNLQVINTPQPLLIEFGFMGSCPIFSFYFFRFCAFCLFVDLFGNIGKR